MNAPRAIGALTTRLTEATEYPGVLAQEGDVMKPITPTPDRQSAALWLMLAILGAILAVTAWATLVLG